MQFLEKETNTSARGSNNQERTKWREAGVDPEDVADPYDVAEAARKRREAEAERNRQDCVAASVADHLGVLVAEQAMATPEPKHPGQVAVQLSFGGLS